jgi:hypothetical protein
MITGTSGSRSTSWRGHWLCARQHVGKGAPWCVRSCTKRTGRTVDLPCCGARCSPGSDRHCGPNLSGRQQNHTCRTPTSPVASFGRQRIRPVRRGAMHQQCRQSQSRPTPQNVRQKTLHPTPTPVPVPRWRQLRRGRLRCGQFLVHKQDVRHR